jgi:hypothetical protein
MITRKREELSYQLSPFAFRRPCGSRADSRPAQPQWLAGRACEAQRLQAAA